MTDLLIQAGLHRCYKLQHYQHNSVDRALDAIQRAIGFAEQRMQLLQELESLLATQPENQPHD